MILHVRKLSERLIALKAPKLPIHTHSLSVQNLEGFPLFLGFLDRF